MEFTIKVYTFAYDKQRFFFLSCELAVGATGVFQDARPPGLQQVPSTGGRSR